MRIILIFALVISIYAISKDNGAKKTEEQELIIDGGDPIPTYGPNEDTFPARMIPAHKFKEKIIPIER